MKKYKVIAGDQKEYGPVSMEEIAEWIRQGRANGETRVQAEGASDWTPLRDVPELAALLGAPAPTPVAPVTTMPAGAAGGEDSPLPADVLSRDHDVWGSGCLGRSFTLYQSRFGLATGVMAALLGIVVATWIILFFVNLILAFIPIVGFFASIILQIMVSLALVPLYVGPMYIFMRQARGQTASFGDLFAGYRRALGQCMLGATVQYLLMLVAMIPGVMVLLFTCWTIIRPIFEAMMEGSGGGPPPLPEFGGGQLLGFLAGLLLIYLPIIYLSTCWIFSLPLIVDKRIGFWQAMETSRKAVNKHWFMVFFYLMVGGVILTVGALLCGIGLLFATPVFAAMMATAYCHIFDARHSPAQP